MKMICIILLIVLPVCSYLIARPTQTMCLFGILYYDWEGREPGVVIPVLKNGEPVKCSPDTERYTFE